MLIINKNFEIIDINNSGLQLLELTPEEVLYKKCHELIFFQSSPCLHCTIKKNIESKQTETREIYWKEKDKWLLIKSTPALDAHNEIKYFIDLLVDIT